MKTLILAMDSKGAPSWVVNANCKQIVDWFKANKTIMPIENLIILPTDGETRLYWLEGDVENPEDVRTLEEIRDRIKPVLELSLDISVDRAKLYKDPYARRPSPMQLAMKNHAQNARTAKISKTIPGKASSQENTEKPS